MSGDANALGPFGQLLGVGLLWISFHCSGMCGPLLVGLDVGGVTQGASAARGVLSVLLYQLGRALTYAVLGGLAGLFGAGLRSLFEPAGAVLALGLGVALLGASARRRRRPSELVTLGARPRRTQAGRLLLALTTRLGLVGGVRDPLRVLTLGMVMGFLPCMIPLWALGLSAVTGSLVAGAGVMLLLVAMTTPVLLVATLLPRLAPRRLSRLPWLPRALMGLSGLWLALVGAAGLGVLPHAHVAFEVASRQFMVMFF